MYGAGRKTSDGTFEMSDHNISDFGNYYTGAWSGHIFYSLLSCDKPAGDGRSKRSWGCKSSICNCTWYCLYCIHTKRSVPERLLERQKIIQETKEDAVERLLMAIDLCYNKKTGDILVYFRDT